VNASLEFLGDFRASATSKLALRVLDLALLGDPPNNAQLADLLTVETIAAFIEQALAERDQQPALGQG
jgi:hypothetical protein